MLTLTVCNSSNPVHLFKVNSHADIAGNECANAVARHLAAQIDAKYADPGISYAGIDGNPF